MKVSQSSSKSLKRDFKFSLGSMLSSMAPSPLPLHFPKMSSDSPKASSYLHSRGQRSLCSMCCLLGLRCPLVKVLHHTALRTSTSVFPGATSVVSPDPEVSAQQPLCLVEDGHGHCTSVFSPDPEVSAQQIGRAHV